MWRFSPSISGFLFSNVDILESSSTLVPDYMEYDGAVAFGGGCPECDDGPMPGGAMPEMAETNLRVPKPKTRSEFPETWLWIDEKLR